MPQETIAHGTSDMMTSTIKNVRNDLTFYHTKYSG